MTNNNFISTIFAFCFGTVLGAFVATITIREALPLREHYIAIIISAVLSIIIVIGLILWYFNVVNSCRRILGQRGGRLCNSILSFLIVSIAILFILIVGIFFAAIA